MSDPANTPDTEARLPGGSELHRLSSQALVERMAIQEARAVRAVADAAGAIGRVIDALSPRFARGGRLIYAGAGTSGRLGLLDAVEQYPTFGVAPGRVLALLAGGEEALFRAVEGAEDDRDGARARLLALELTPDDTLIGIAASGRTPWVLGALEVARTFKALTVGLTCVPGSPVATEAELAIELDTGPELISGSTRLKAGTATKLALNAISTGTMVRLGKTHGDLMVDVRVTNEKLAERARRILATLTGLEGDAADALLERCGGEVKTAVVVERLGIDPDDAREQLEAVGGHLRDALGED